MGGPQPKPKKSKIKETKQKKKNDKLEKALLSPLGSQICVFFWFWLGTPHKVLNLCFFWFWFLLFFFWFDFFLVLVGGHPWSPISFFSVLFCCFLVLVSLVLVLAFSFESNFLYFVFVGFKYHLILLIHC